MSSSIERVISTENPTSGLLANVARLGLSGLANLYDAGLTAYLAAEKAGLRRRGRLPVPVVSVGNLSVGGTGKTPMTAFLVNHLHDAGLRVAILSRGHGGESHDVRVVSDGSKEPLLTAQQAGDEPVLLARACPGVPVLVGKDRRESGREALRRWPLDMIVLDDGFQYWQLERDLDIVLLDARRPFENGHPLPRGLLREPMRNLSRAGIVVATRADRIDTAARDDLRRRVFELAPHAPLYFSEHVPLDLAPIGVDGPPVALDHLQALRVAAVSAIARPESFVGLLRTLGAQVVHEEHKPDHGAYTAGEVQALEQRARDAGATAIVITQKDAVKWPDASEALPTLALRITVTIDEEPAFFEAVRSQSTGS